LVSDFDGVVEGFGDERGSDHVVHRAGGEDLAFAEEGGVGGAGGEFFEVVGDQDPGEVGMGGVDLVEVR
jgi:hypothetical protein